MTSLNIKTIGIRLGGQMQADWPIVCAVVEAGRGRQSRVSVCVSCPLAVGMLPHAEAITPINAMERPHSSVSGKYRNKTYKYRINRHTTNSKILHFKLIHDLIQEGCIKLIKSVSKDIYNVTKDLYFKYMLFFLIFYTSKNTKKCILMPTNILRSTFVFNTDKNKMLLEHQISILE